MSEEKKELIINIIEVNSLIPGPNMAIIELSRFSDFLDLLNPKSWIYKIGDTLYILSTLDCFIYNLKQGETVEIIKNGRKKHNC